MICPDYTPSLPATQIQMWLRTLAKKEGVQPLPAVDGIYSENTAEAVRRFQAAHGLPVTGVVDFASWTAIRDAAMPVCACTGRPGPLYVNCPETSLNAKGGYLYIVQAMLNTLSPHFGNLPVVAYTGEYDTSTRDLVGCIQKASGLPDNGVLDRLTWNAMASLYNANQDRTPLSWLLSS